MRICINSDRNGYICYHRCLSLFYVKLRVHRFQISEYITFKLNHHRQTGYNQEWMTGYGRTPDIGLMLLPTMYAHIDQAHTQWGSTTSSQLSPTQWISMPIAEEMKQQCEAEFQTNEWSRISSGHFSYKLLEIRHELCKYEISEIRRRPSNGVWHCVWEDEFHKHGSHLNN